MSLLANLREHQSRAARVAAAVFAFAWLGFAVAPCQAMMPATDQAPHHGSMPMNDCPHCPPAVDTTPDCATAVPADCLGAVQPMMELRQADEVKPAAVIPVAAFDSAHLAAVPRTPRPPGSLAAPVPRASLQQRYCSYLK